MSQATPENRDEFYRATALTIFSERITNNAPITFEEAFRAGAEWHARFVNNRIDGTSSHRIVSETLEHLTSLYDGSALNKVIVEFSQRKAQAP